MVLAGAPSLASALLISPRDFALCAVMGAVQVGGGLTLFTLGARHVPVAELTLLSLTELALAPIWVWLAVGEVPSGYTLIGGAIIVIAITYQALSGARRTARCRWCERADARTTCRSGCNCRRRLRRPFGDRLVRARGAEAGGSCSAGPAMGGSGSA